MVVDPRCVYLVSGQILVVEGGNRVLSSKIEQRVVVAENERVAYSQLALSEPQFRPVGHATLAEHEQAVAQIRATLSGQYTGWAIYVSPGVAFN